MTRDDDEAGRATADALILGERDRDSLGALLAGALADDLERLGASLLADSTILEPLVDLAKPGLVRALPALTRHTSNPTEEELNKHRTGRRPVGCAAMTVWGTV